MNILLVLLPKLWPLCSAECEVTVMAMPKMWPLCSAECVVTVEEDAVDYVEDTRTRAGRSSFSPYL